MPTLPFVTTDVFTSTRYAGNPLAIVLLPPEPANTLSTPQMQRIAREFNLSETVFLHAGTPGEDAAAATTASPAQLQWRVRIFTTNEELPFAGHPTIGAAAYALSHQEGALAGKLLCNAGTIHISSLPDQPTPSSSSSSVSDDTTAPAKSVRAEIPHNFHRHVEHTFSVEDVLALQPGLKDVGLSPAAIAVVSPVLGMNFVVVEVPDLEALGKVRVGGSGGGGGAKAVAPKLDREWDQGFAATYFYAFVDGEGGNKVRSRMIEGGMEDPATGSAACGLASYLAMKGAGSRGREQRFEITQGVEMGRESIIGVEVTLTEGLDGLEGLVLSGSAVKVMEGTVEY